LTPIAGGETDCPLTAISSSRGNGCPPHPSADLHRV
jgi:hypothetical protein